MVSVFYWIDTGHKWNESFFWLLLLINLLTKGRCLSGNGALTCNLTRQECRTGANRMAPTHNPKNGNKLPSVLCSFVYSTWPSWKPLASLLRIRTIWQWQTTKLSESAFHQIIVIGLGIGRAQVTMALTSGTMHKGTKVHAGDEFCFTCFSVSLTRWQFDFSARLGLVWLEGKPWRPSVLSLVILVDCISQSSFIIMWLTCLHSYHQQSIGLKCWRCKVFHRVSEWVRKWRGLGLEVVHTVDYCKSCWQWNQGESPFIFVHPMTSYKFNYTKR